MKEPAAIFPSDGWRLTANGGYRPENQQEGAATNDIGNSQGTGRVIGNKMALGGHDKRTCMALGRQDKRGGFAPWRAAMPQDLSSLPLGVRLVLICFGDTIHGSQSFPTRRKLASIRHHAHARANSTAALHVGLGVKPAADASSMPRRRRTARQCGAGRLRRGACCNQDDYSRKQGGARTCGTEGEHPTAGGHRGRRRRSSLGLQGRRGDGDRAWGCRDLTRACSGGAKT